MNADLEALAPELARLDALIDNEMRRMRARYELSRDEFHGLYITDERVEALLRASQTPQDAAAIPDIMSTRERDTSSRWYQLADALGLDHDERDLLLIALAPELDAKYETLYAYLNDDVTRRYATPELAARLLGRDAADRISLRALLLPSARLQSLGAIELAAPARDDIRARRAIRAARPLADWVQGLAYVDERLTTAARWGAFEPILSAEALPAEIRSSLDGLVVRFADRVAVPPVVLSADAASEAALIGEDLFARAGRLALIVDVAVLRTMPGPMDVVTGLLLAQQVLGAGIVMTPLDALAEAEGRALDACLPAVRQLARRSPAVICAAGSRVHSRDLLGDVNSLDIPVRRSEAAERAAAWRLALADIGDGVSRSTVDALADRFTLGADRIFRAALAARQMAALDGTATSAAHLFAAARAVSAEGSGGTTRTVATPFEWDDLVLPADVKARLADMVHAIQDRSRVLDDWGFARRIGGARGVKVMFAGASGTGKSTGAAIVARTLQLDLQRLELGTVVSKYIGETEKNLDRAFDAARRSNAVLFIDEADALLGKRSQVKDAHDRYANVEIAYLLQKMEDHDGVVIVATNLAQNIDDAFARRMQYVIEFPLPDATCREQLWRGMFPATAPIAPDVDFAFLARQFELAGGDIRNIVLDAAYCAAQDGAAIGLRGLLGAIARQYAKRGKVPTPAEFREHYALLFHNGPARNGAPVIQTGTGAFMGP